MTGEVNDSDAKVLFNLSLNASVGVSAFYIMKLPGVAILVQRGHLRQLVPMVLLSKKL